MTIAEVMVVGLWAMLVVAKYNFGDSINGFVVNYKVCRLVLLIYRFSVFFAVFLYLCLHKQLKKIDSLVIF